MPERESGMIITCLGKGRGVGICKKRGLTRLEKRGDRAERDLGRGEGSQKGSRGGGKEGGKGGGTLFGGKGQRFPWVERSLAEGEGGEDRGDVESLSKPPLAGTSSLL